MPRITVALTSFNHEKYIAGSVQSVLNQTFQDFEIIITDDGSIDGSVEVIKTFTDPRIRLFRFNSNKGTCVTLNNCINEAKGEYIAILHSDDQFMPDKLEKQISILDKNSKIGAVFSYVQLIDEEGRDFNDANHPYYHTFRQSNKTRFQWLHQFFYHANALCHPSALMRKECFKKLGNYDERMAQMADFDLWIRLCMKYEIFVIPEQLTKYRIHPLNASNNKPEPQKRLVTEHTYILGNYLNIETADDFFSIFPSAKRFQDGFEERLIPFYISMLALEKDTIMHQNFAISTLFDFLKDHDLRKKLGDMYGFSMSDFIRLTGKYDLYNIESENIVNYRNILQAKDNTIVQHSAHVQIQRQSLVEKEKQILQLQKRVDDIQARLGWKLLNKVEHFQNCIFPLHTSRRIVCDRVIRGVKTFLDRRLRVKRIYKNLSDEPLYNAWILKNEPDPDQLRMLQIESQTWSYHPKISIITPVFNPNKYDLTQCMQSVMDQIYENWELCLVDGGSDKFYVRKVINKFADRDHRIKFVTLPKNLGIAGNSNEALKLATGEYVGLLDHDDLLAPFALYEVVRNLNQDSAIDFLYSDEDKVPANGRERYGHYFKPDWSPDTFLSYNYICHFAVVRRELIEEVGGFCEGYDGAQDYDLFLRLTEKANCIRRIPKILYHWRAATGSVASSPDAKPLACVSAKKAIQEHLIRKGIEAEVMDGVFLTSYRVKYRIRPFQKVCIIIPTRDKVHLLKQCVSSILNKTDHKNYEIVIVDNQSIEDETIAYFDSLKNEARIKIAQYGKPFNFSAINNYAANMADAEFLLFLNNDTEVISSEWLTAMLEFAQREDVGAVGAKLFYPNDTIQHAGVILGTGVIAIHSHRGFPRGSHGDMGRICIIQNIGAVTGACMMIRREVFEEVGGFDERLSHAYNDVDFCLKIRDRGYLIVYTPYAELYHHESASRGYEDTPERQARFFKEKDILYMRWKHIFDAGDPYYNPNLTLEKEDFSIKV